MSSAAVLEPVEGCCLLAPGALGSSVQSISSCTSTETAFGGGVGRAGAGAGLSLLSELRSLVRFPFTIVAPGQALSPYGSWTLCRAIPKHSERRPGFFYNMFV